jgi:hypothetical protein
MSAAGVARNRAASSANVAWATRTARRLDGGSSGTTAAAAARSAAMSSR